MRLQSQLRHCHSLCDAADVYPRQDALEDEITRGGGFLHGYCGGASPSNSPTPPTNALLCHRLPAPLSLNILLSTTSMTTVTNSGTFAKRRSACT